MRSLLLALALPGTASEQTPLTTLTLAEARMMDHSALARHVLGATGDRYTEHRIIVGEGGMRGVRGIDQIEFATAPEPEYGGLCHVERLRVSFAPLDYKLRDDPPVRVESLAIDQLWANLPVAGKPSGGDCRALGTALEPPQQPGPYFTATNGRRGGGSALYAVTVGRALRLLRRVIADRGAGADFLCLLGEDKDPPAAACTDRAIAFNLLDIARLSRIEVRRCDARAELCVTFAFADPSDGEFQGSGLALELRTDAAGDGELGDSPRVIRARLSTELWVV